MTTKEQVQRILDHLPEDCSLEEVQYHLYVAETVQRRLVMADDAKEHASESEAERRMKRWLTD